MSAQVTQTISGRIFTFLEHGLVLTVIGIVGGLAGIFVDGRWFLILCAPISLALHRSRALDGSDRRAKLITHSVVFVVSMLLLLALGIEINKSREHIPTAYEIAAAVTSLGSGPAPVLQDDLAYGATFVGIANMPERQHVKTWNEKPWDESNYSDVRLTIGNTHDFPLENLDLEISVSEGDKEQLVAGIDQLSAVSGVEFRRPSVPQTPPVRLRGRDGNTYNLPIDSMLDKTHFPSPSYKMFCPRLLAKDGLRLIIAAAFTGRIKRPPERLRISGSYETAPSEGSKRVQVDKIVQVAK